MLVKLSTTKTVGSKHQPLGVLECQLELLAPLSSQPAHAKSRLATQEGEALRLVAMGGL
jgi:hypothetical protein